MPPTTAQTHLAGGRFKRGHYQPGHVKTRQYWFENDAKVKNESSDDDADNTKSLLHQVEPALFFSFFKIMTAHDDELLSLHQYYVKEYYMCAVGKKKKKNNLSNILHTHKGATGSFIYRRHFPVERRAPSFYYVSSRERERERGSYHRAFWFHSCDHGWFTHHGALTGATCVPTAEWKRTNRVKRPSLLFFRTCRFQKPQQRLFGRKKNEQRDGLDSCKRRARKRGKNNPKMTVTNTYTSYKKESSW